MPYETTKGRQELLRAVVSELEALVPDDGRAADPLARTRPAIRAAIEARRREHDAIERTHDATAETLPSGQIVRAAPRTSESAGRYSYVSARRSERR